MRELINFILKGDDEKIIGSLNIMLFGLKVKKNIVFLLIKCLKNHEPIIN